MADLDSDPQLVLVSNRGPATFARSEDGQVEPKRGGGGLVTALTGLQNIDNTLENLDENRGDGAGLKPIIEQVGVINSQLISVRTQDTAKIETDLTNRGDGVATHVRNICNATSAGRRCGD